MRSTQFPKLIMPFWHADRQTVKNATKVGDSAGVFVTNEILRLIVIEFVFQQSHGRLQMDSIAYEWLQMAVQTKQQIIDSNTN